MGEVKTIEIGHDWMTLEQLEEIIASGAKLKLGAKAITSIQKCRDYLDKKMAKGKDIIYGINTGFGSLCNTEPMLFVYNGES